MPCPICDQKPMNCDCSEKEREQFDELEDLQAENEVLRRRIKAREPIMFKGQLGKDMMIEQGYVPPTCTLHPESAGPIIFAEINKGKSPCAGCNHDRSICKGQPRDPSLLAVPDP